MLLTILLVVLVLLALGECPFMAAFARVGLLS
jgi:hypothetical protein